MNKLTPFTLLGLTLPAAMLPAKDGRPNIMLVYIDDLGYSDLGCYGSIYGNPYEETPNIDSLAKCGIQFLNAYSSAPISTAARAGLMTGLYPARLGIEFVTSYEKNAYSWRSPQWKKKFEDKKLLPPPLTLNLPLETPTIAEILSDNGYETGIVGKWHLAAHNGVYNGWSEYFGPERRGFEWARETFGSHTYSGKKETEVSPSFPEDEITLNAIEFIEKEHDRPFFLFVSHYYVHTPVKVRSREIIDELNAKYPELSQDRIQYLAFLKRMDYYVGQLMTSLDKAGLRDDTIVIFASDNGGNPEYAFNRPLRGSKWNLYEGGVRIPMIVSWKGRITPSLNYDVVSQLDLFPTILDLAQVNEEVKSDGISMISLFEGDDSGFENRTLLWHFPYYHPEGDKYYNAIDTIGVEDCAVSKTKPQSALLDGNYKLIYFYETGKCEVYDLEKDPSEGKDISAYRKSLTKRLKKKLFLRLYDIDARMPLTKDPDK